MNNIMIVSSTEKGAVLLDKLLKEQSAGLAAEICRSASEARRVLQENDPELLVINTPLKDEFGHELALTASEKTSAGIILTVQAELAEDIEARVEDSGVIVVPKPISRSLFHHAVKVALSIRKRILGLKRENVQLQKKIDEIRLVDRAKCCLIQSLNMSEPQAHRYIEKRAMDERVSRMEIAESILKTYEM